MIYEPIVSLCSGIILFWLFALLEGYFQGHYYDLYPTDNGHKNIHWVYVCFRSIVLWLIIKDGYHWTGPGLSIVYFVILVFSYPFFHNGMLYSTRNWLNKKIYTQGWWDNKEKEGKYWLGKAWIEIEVGFRVGMFIFAMVALYFFLKDVYALNT